MYETRFLLVNIVGVFISFLFSRRNTLVVVFDACCLGNKYVYQMNGLGIGLYKDPSVSPVFLCQYQIRNWIKQIQFLGKWTTFLHFNLTFLHSLYIQLCAKNKSSFFWSLYTYIDYLITEGFWWPITTNLEIANLPCA